MNNKPKNTLQAIFAKPASSSLEWARIESLFIAAGARTIEGNGSRERFELNGVIGTFHRPHPDKEAKPYQVRDARAFLEQAGVTP
ncbi:Type II toxin-antitoxin system HicA family toxin [Pseudomonas sp. 8Z]|uniref:type II toxin-antitoxin system HicA family toxin n=1 Tax=Pseudomonas sp. 8Z TaxID=2653166 RepID=UPI0012F45FB2|nr:Type II toxin-antitoxin system HicA family toxin [Pseudomonas sp. 8Z]